jgi:hypothetical protein
MRVRNVRRYASSNVQPFATVKVAEIPSPNGNDQKEFSRNARVPKLQSPHCDL